MDLWLQVVPVDLNAYLYDMEINIAKFAKVHPKCCVQPALVCTTGIHELSAL